ncbi:cysteine desulfurase family protein [Halobacillus halophilus]|uniref:cysteine desulfurase family protein n=1 Tax=Halobacillus halophilus TaxID=1570 RepID=UPI001CD74790|nr:cysteine desulfurase family protein [Halobacillus halophilus]MCA1009778.1 cysteine desulfurase [Halobacillus halophilus]
MKGIYLDHAATSPVHPKVVESMIPVLEETYGNPSSVHQFGRQARKTLDEARKVIARSIHASEKEIVFTSGGTEADNLAIIGTARAREQEGKHIITTPIEHHATLHAVEYLEEEGFEVTYLPVDDQGAVRAEDVRESLRDDTILVSIMMVNNETGVMQPVKEVAELLREHSTSFHSDIVQAYGLMEIDVTELAVDLMAVSGHKINGPKGIGFLYVREGTKLESLQHGGEQERKRRAGTENLPAVKGLQTAVELIEGERNQKRKQYKELKETFLHALNEEGVNYSINGAEEYSIESIINISFPEMNVETMLTNFDLSGIAASSGSACTAGSVEPSHVLSAMYGTGDPRTTNSIRFSFGQSNSKEDLIQAAQKISQIVQRLSITGR